MNERINGVSSETATRIVTSPMTTGVPLTLGEFIGYEVLPAVGLSGVRAHVGLTVEVGQHHAELDDSAPAEPAGTVN